MARHLAWLGPLFARIVTGWVFLVDRLGASLTHLPLVTENFVNWGIPACCNCSRTLRLGRRVFRRHLSAAGAHDADPGERSASSCAIVAVKSAQWESTSSRCRHFWALKK